MENLNLIALGLSLGQSIVSTGNQDTCNAICGVYEVEKKALFVNSVYHRIKKEVAQAVADKHNIDVDEISIVLSGDHFRIDTWNTRIDNFLPKASFEETEDYIKQREQGNLLDIKYYAEGDVVVGANHNLGGFYILVSGSLRHANIPNFNMADKRARYLTSNH